MSGNGLVGCCERCDGFMTAIVAAVILSVQLYLWPVVTLAITVVEGGLGAVVALMALRTAVESFRECGGG
jgi:hypothetical protein